MSKSIIALMLILVPMFAYDQSNQGWKFLDSVDYRESLSEKFNRMKLIAYTSPDRIELQITKSDRISIDKSYSIITRKVQYDYSLFPMYNFEEILKVKDFNNELKNIFILFIQLFMKNIQQTDNIESLIIKNMTIPQEKYKELFNADAGISLFSKINERANKKYKYMENIFLLKNGSGIIVITIYSNDVNYYNQMPLSDLITFTFK